MNIIDIRGTTIKQTNSRIVRDYLATGENNLNRVLFGNPIFIVDSQNALPNYDKLRPLTDLQSKDIDRIRYYAAAFWAKDEKGSVYFATDDKEVNDKVFISFKEESRELKTDSSGSYYEEVYQVFTDSGEDLFTLDQSLDQELSLRNFVDHACDFDTLVDKKIADRRDSKIQTTYAEVKPDYNYYIKEYEDAIDVERIPEKGLPNLYAFFEADDFKTETFEDFLTLGGNIEQQRANGFRFRKIRDESGATIERRSRPVARYFESWSDAVGFWIKSDRYARTISEFTNLVFSQKDIRDLQENNESKELMPMFVDIKFSTDVNAQLNAALDDLKLATKLQQDVSLAIQESELINIPTFEAQTQTSSQNGLPQVVTGRDTKRIYDFGKWLENYSELSSGENSVVFNDENERPDDPRFEFFYNLMSLIGKSKVDEIVRNNLRSFQDLMVGTKCYNEAVFYRVDKHEGLDSLNEAPIQSFYFSNLGDARELEYVDTQVKYGKTYTYRIYAMNLIVGSSYSYERLKSDIGLTRMMVRTRPSLQIMEVPIFKKSVIVLDNPPIAPDVDIIPFRGINNKVRIALNSGIGRYDLHPEIIQDLEQQQIDDFRLAQDLEPDEKIRFETDDKVDNFIIYRLDREPMSYRDFREGSIREVSTLRASSSSTNDMIEPNKKYYYCIKAVDVHSHYSYPSAVYQVEIVDDAGSVYALINTFEFREPDVKAPSRGIKRFIHIAPTASNAFVNHEKSGITGGNQPKPGQKVILGNTEDPVWGKKFKVRLTSKSTGKKIDFNLEFDYEAEKQ
jgi:hypothetical protein